MDCLRAVLDTKFADKLTFRLQQTQLAGTCDRFGAPLDVEFAKDVPIVPFTVSRVTFSLYNLVTPLWLPTQMAVYGL